MVFFETKPLPTDPRPQLHPRSAAKPHIAIECRSLAEKTHVITLHLDGFAMDDGYNLINTLVKGDPKGPHFSYGDLKEGVHSVVPAVDRSGFHCAVNFTSVDAARGLLAAAEPYVIGPRTLQNQLQQAAAAKHELERPR